MTQRSATPFCLASPAVPASDRHHQRNTTRTNLNPAFVVASCSPSYPTQAGTLHSHLTTGSQLAAGMPDARLHPHSLSLPVLSSLLFFASMYRIPKSSSPNPEPRPRLNPQNMHQLPSFSPLSLSKASCCVVVHNSALRPNGTSLALPTHPLPCANDPSHQAALNPPQKHLQSLFVCIFHSVSHWVRTGATDI